MFQQVIVLGRLGGDPEVKRLESGATVAKLSVAVSESYKDKDGNKIEKTEWFNCVAWRSQAEFLEKYFKKGDPIHVTGKLETRTFEDKDKIKRYVTELIISHVNFVPGKTGENAAAAKQEKQTHDSTNLHPVATEEEVQASDLPF